MKLYFDNHGRAKLLIGLGTGKKLYDKRETSKERDWNREKARIMAH
jgi:SsrA-binding protein